MTRMWMVNTEIMCRQHLLGEHKELHQLRGQLKKRYGVNKYIENNCLEITSIITRHDQLVQEMLRRGYNHKSPFGETQFELIEISSYLPEFQVNTVVDLHDAYSRLINKCDHCRQNILEHLTDPEKNGKIVHENIIIDVLIKENII